jgi:hypothetical protein
MCEVSFPIINDHGARRYKIVNDIAQVDDFRMWVSNKTTVGDVRKAFLDKYCMECGTVILK